MHYYYKLLYLIIIIIINYCYLYIIITIIIIIIARSIDKIIKDIPDIQRNLNTPARLRLLQSTRTKPFHHPEAISVYSLALHVQIFIYFSFCMVSICSSKLTLTAQKKK